MATGRPTAIKLRQRHFWAQQLDKVTSILMKTMTIKCFGNVSRIVFRQGARLLNSDEIEGEGWRSADTRLNRRKGWQRREENYFGEEGPRPNWMSTSKKRQNAFDISKYTCMHGKLDEHTTKKTHIHACKESLMNTPQRRHICMHACLESLMTTIGFFQVCCDTFCQV